MGAHYRNQLFPISVTDLRLCTYPTLFQYNLMSVVGPPAAYVPSS